MNVMAKAHKAAKTAKALGSTIAYRELFRVALKQAHKEYKAMQENQITGFDSNRLNVPNRLAYSFNGKSRSVEVYATEQGLFVMCFYKGRLQLNANCKDDVQAKGEAQRWMSFDK